MSLQEEKRRLLDKLAEEITDQRVLDAIRSVPRERFLPARIRHLAYDDVALPIAAAQTISQPLIVALTVEALDLRRFDRVLEIGTGSGYQAAVMAEIARSVTSVERIPDLATSAKTLLHTLGYDNVRVEIAGRSLGRLQDPPYNAIAVAAAAPRIPNILMAQLLPGGRLVAPVGSLREQTLIKMTKTAEGISIRSLGGCRFVPLIGRDAWSEDEIAQTGDERREAHSTPPRRYMHMEPPDIVPKPHVIVNARRFPYT